MFLVKLSFVFGTIVSAPIRNSRVRRRMRGKINLFILRPYIRRFIRKQYGVKLESVRFVRQQTLNRVVGLVNDRYFVKIFRNVSVKRIQDFVRLMGIVEQSVDVTVPHILADDKIAMFAYEKIDGLDINKFDKDFVVDNDTKLFNQVKNIIKQLQSINVKKIPNYETFLTGIYGWHYGNPNQKSKHLVLGHFDMNFGSFLFNKNFDIIAVIDWDTIAITDNIDTDWSIFMKYWQRYIR